MDKANFFSDDAETHFTEKVILFLREQIQIYQGQEILFGGRTLSESFPKIGECEILSRGNQEQVPLVSKVSQYEVIIHNHPSSYLNPSAEDLEIASSYADEIGFMIIDNRVEKVNVVTPIPQLSQDNPVEVEVILKAFASGGSLSQVLPEFEPRASQNTMIKEVTAAFNQEKVLLCEAETGIGKSLGYGFIAGYWALLNKKKVIISTNTINLQEQLLNKDLPVIRECLRRELGQTLEVVLVKGKNHYLCQRKFEEFVKENKDTLDLSLEDKTRLAYKDEIISWGQVTLSGDKNELSFIPDPELWDQLGCENDTCQRKHCRHESRCFQLKLKRDLAKADILVVNHHILCADLAIKKGSEGSLLPPYERLIIDEAHHLEDIATIYFGSQASTFEVKRSLGLIARVDLKKRILKGGLLNRILNQLSPKLLGSKGNRDEEKDISHESDLQKTFYQQLNAFIEARIAYEDFAPEVFEKIFSYFAYSNKKEEPFFNFEEEPIRKEIKHRFKREEFDHPRWHELYKQPLEQILKHLQTLVDMVTHIHKLLERANHPEDQPPSYLIELKAYGERLQNTVSNFQASMEIAEREEVRWIRIVKNKQQVYLASHISPLGVGDILKEYLFLPLKTVVLTSATLSSGSGNEDDLFVHIKERLGLSSLGKDSLSEIHLTNNFDYAQNCKMLVPPLPPVNGREFLPALIHELRDLLDFFRGRMLWLFTSYSMMKQVHRQLISPAREMGVELWIQGDEPRHELIRKIKENRNGVILGVSSFWEGVDIKGESLSCLVMIKLPFAVPDEPILEARLERLEAQGKNPFLEYSLPQAILRFKQGFGRLIRSPQDRGVFILFDNRILTKYYGRAFIAALPPGLKPLPRKMDEELRFQNKI